MPSAVHHRGGAGVEVMLSFLHHALGYNKDLALSATRRLEFRFFFIVSYFTLCWASRRRKSSGFGKGPLMKKTHLDLWELLGSGKHQKWHCQRVRVGKMDAIRGCMEFI
jgi:hypothetical protein